MEVCNREIVELNYESNKPGIAERYSALEIRHEFQKLGAKRFATEIIEKEQIRVDKVSEVSLKQILPVKSIQSVNEIRPI